MSLPRPLTRSLWMCAFLAAIGAASLQAQPTGLSLTTTSPLPAAITGTSYSQTFKASGGTTPYQWAAGTGVPQGLTLDANTGILFGTPTTTGNYSFVVQVTDNAGQHASNTFALAVNAPALQIVTVPPLFSGQVGQAYSQTFTASGGTQPYTWSIASGNTGGLTLDSKSGVLSGTPQTAGTFTFVVQVADSAKATATQSFSVTIAPPSLLITAGASLPNGAVGVAYDQKIAVTASGGTAPYTWSLVNGAVPGLNFLPATIELSGTPTTAGTYTLTLKATDAAGATGTRAVSLTIAAASLTITSNRQLTSASLNAAYSQTLAATGGTPPYTWSANGLPSGLSINSGTGVISGTPTAAGNFTPVVTVTDSALGSYRDNFSLTVQLPSAPKLTIGGLPSTTTAAQQISVGISISSAFTAAIQGQLVLTFQPTSGPNDSTIQFANGTRTVTFNIPAGSTAATFPGSGGSSTAQVQLQTGTTAGSIVLSLSNVTAAGVDITPSPAPSATSQIAAAAPVISSVQVIRNADTTTGCKASQICLEVTGYATAREVTQGVFTFSAVSGQSLQGSAGSITVDETSTFSSWFGTSTMGSQFILVQSFNVTGDPNNVLSGAVTLTNHVGSATTTVNK